MSMLSMSMSNWAGWHLDRCWHLTSDDITGEWVIRFWSPARACTTANTSLTLPRDSYLWSNAPFLAAGCAMATENYTDIHPVFLGVVTHNLWVLLDAWEKLIFGLISDQPSHCWNSNLQYGLTSDHNHRNPPTLTTDQQIWFAPQ